MSRASLDGAVANVLVEEAREYSAANRRMLPVLLGSQPANSSQVRPADEGHVHDCGSHTEPAVAAFHPVAGREQLKLLEWLGHSKPAKLSQVRPPDEGHVHDCGSHTEPTGAVFDSVAGREQLKLLEWLDRRMGKMESTMMAALDRHFQDLVLRVRPADEGQPSKGSRQCAPGAFARGLGVGAVELKESTSVASHSESQSPEVRSADESHVVDPSEQNPEEPADPRSRRRSVGRSDWYGRRISCADGSSLQPSRPRTSPRLLRRAFTQKEVQGFQRPRRCGCFFLAVVAEFYLPAIVASSKCKVHKLDYINFRGKLRALSTMIEADQAMVYSVNHRRSARTHVDDSDGELDDKTKERVAEFALISLEEVDRDLRKHQDLFWYAGVPLEKFLGEYEKSTQMIARSESTTQMLWELGRLVAEVDELSRYIGTAMDQADQLPLKLATLFMICVSALSKFVFSYFGIGFAD